jgi:protoporphyrinogen oxidase
MTGLVAAAAAQRQGAEVVVLEPQPHLGGLLGSVQSPSGAWFDYGTHIPAETGHAALDEILFGHIDDSIWRDVSPVRAGNVFQNQLNDQSPFPDLRGLPGDVYARAVVELLENPTREAPWPNARAELTETFGPTIAGEVFEPALKRLLGTDLEQLDPGAHRLFFSRVIGLSAQATSELKRVPYVDERLAFHDGATGASSHPSRYPISGGAGRWVSEVVARNDLRGSVRFSTPVTAASVRDGQVVSVSTPDEEHPCDHLVWSLPAAPLLTATDIDLPPGLAPPPRRAMTLLHLELSEPVATDPGDSVPQPGWPTPQCRGDLHGVRHGRHAARRSRLGGRADRG